MIGGREPAFWIGLVVTIIVGLISTLTENGVISEALKGRIQDLTNAIAQLLVLLAPLIAGLLIRQQVTPVAAPSLPVGTPVLIPGQTSETPAAKVTASQHSI